MSNTIQQNPNPAQPTDGSAVNNIQPYVTGGYGGPHAVFDRDHYKSQVRLDEKLVEFSALQGALKSLGYTWAINLISYGDNNVTEMISTPPIDPAVTDFFWNQMDTFIALYQPKKLYFVYSKNQISIDDYVRGTFP